MKTFKNNLVQFTQYGMGTGDTELSTLLATNYLTILNAENDLPRFIAFYNEGVKLLCTGSPALEILKTIHEKGVKLMACKTCLNHYNLTDKMETGMASTMIDIIELQRIANKVINL